MLERADGTEVVDGERARGGGEGEDVAETDKERKRSSDEPERMKRISPNLTSVFWYSKQASISENRMGVVAK